MSKSQTKKQECICKLNPCYSIQCECSLHNFVHGHCLPEQPEAAEWEQEFEKKFECTDENPCTCGDMDKVKAFISKCLASQKQLYIERLKQLEGYGTLHDAEDGGPTIHIIDRNDAIKAIEEE